MLRSSALLSSPLALSTAAALLGAACGGGESGNLRPSAVAERGRIERVVVATGTVEPGREVEVRPRIAGIVEKIHVEAGDAVQAGQLLIEIERDLLASQAREAEASLREARVELRYARIELDRLEELERSGAVSSQDTDAARSRHERAAAVVARTAARHDTLKTQLSYASIESPLAGRVLDVHVEEGSAVSPVTAVTGGSLLLSLAGTDSMHLEGLVDENEIGRVAVGQPARIRTEAFDDRVFRGAVRKIAPLGSRIQNVTYFEVEIAIEDADGHLRPRMSGDAEIVSEVVEGALVVPETALRYRGERTFVDRKTAGDDSESEELEVEIGIVDGDRVQVLSGLSEGSEVWLQ